MKTQFLNKEEAEAMVDKALLATMMDFTDEWTKQGGKETALPAHVFQNKSAGAKALRDMIRYIIDETMGEETNVAP